MPTTTPGTIDRRNVSERFAVKEASFRGFGLVRRLGIVLFSLNRIFQAATTRISEANQHGGRLGYRRVVGT